MIAAIEAEQIRPAAVVLMDAVRQPHDLVQRLGCPVITMDAPMPGATFLWTPFPLSAPSGRLSDRPVDAIFPARIDNYAGRKQSVSALTGAGVTIRARDDGTTSDAFRAALRSAVAVINMAADRKTDRWQMKGRVIEAGMAGCVLLEQRNPVTELRLKEGRDYLAWDTPDELPALIARARGIDGQMVAENLNIKVTTELTAAAFWQRVSNIAGGAA